MSDVDVSEILALAARLRKVAQMAERGAQQATKETAAIMVLGMQAQITANGSVQTGRMRREVSADVGRLEATVGTRAPYGGFVDGGTSRMVARPFAKPTLDRFAPRYADRVMARIAELTGLA